MKMFKKITSTVLAIMMLMSLVSVIGAGVIIASAAPAYYEFVEMPGFSVWTDEELTHLYHKEHQAGVHSTDNMPAGVEDVVAFKVTSPEPVYGATNISSAYPLNMQTSTNGVLTSPDWAAVDNYNGKSLVGDKSFEDCDGIAFWMGFNKDKYSAKLKIQLSVAPAKGPFYRTSDDGSTDMKDYDVGYRYESTTIYADDEGYFYYDFDKDFRQVDWWATDDDGINQSIYEIGETNTPLPEKVRATFNVINFVCFNAKSGDTIYIGDIKGYKDTRVFSDELDEACSRFESINPDAYTEASYNAATNVYMDAYEILADIESYNKDQVNGVAMRLNTAIDALDPMFPVATDAGINGFEAWDDSALEEMADGGICMDLAFLDTEIHPEGKETSVGIISTATDGAPSYGWSYFTNAADYGDGLEALYNPFGTTISDTAGMGFWISFGKDFAPQEFILTVGCTADEMSFTAIDPYIHYPKGGEGNVYVDWASFEADDGESDIFDYLDSLDYIAIQLPESNQKQYNIADLYVFNWAISPADFTDFDSKFEEYKSDFEALKEADYYPASWENLVAAIDRCERVHATYAITTDELGTYLAQVQAAFDALVKNEGAATFEELSELHNLYKGAKKLWYGNYALSQGNKLTKAVSGYEAVVNEQIASDTVATLKSALETAISGLKQNNPKTYKDDIYSFEDYTPFDLDKCVARRSPGVSYSICTSDGDDFPMGYESALSMVATRNISSTDNAAAMEFYPYYNNYMLRPLNKGVCGNLSGATGFKFFVRVNDLSLAEDATLSFGVMNTTIDKPFNKSATGIKFPASGAGWIYVPTYAITNIEGEQNAINLSAIAAYFFKVEGEVLEGFEVQITAIRAYSGSGTEVPSAPVITSPGFSTVNEAGLIPQWTDGIAFLDGKPYTYGTPIIVNGEHTLRVVTGKEESSVTFTIINGIDPVVTPTVTPGDFDGDEEITVADALAALRIAAKLVEEDPENIAIGDIDKDGHVTVADALAILRVAAKLTDTL